MKKVCAACGIHSISWFENDLELDGTSDCELLALEPCPVALLSMLRARSFDLFQLNCSFAGVKIDRRWTRDFELYRYQTVGSVEQDRYNSEF